MVIIAVIIIPPSLLRLIRPCLIIIHDHPVLDTTFPIRNPPRPHGHQHHPHIIPGNIATTIPIGVRRHVRAKQAGLLLGLVAVAKRVVLQMRLLAPPLLVGPLLEEPRRACDRRADRRQRRRVEVQQQAGQTTAGRSRRRGTGPRARQRVGVGRRRRRAVADPVVHQQADFRVRE